jgi:hypothetical protein
MVVIGEEVHGPGSAVLLAATHDEIVAYECVLRFSIGRDQLVDVEEPPVVPEEAVRGTPMSSSSGVKYM